MEYFEDCLFVGEVEDGLDDFVKVDFVLVMVLRRVSGCRWLWSVSRGVMVDRICPGGDRTSRRIYC
jgi:hypothetical protein